MDAAVIQIFLKYGHLDIQVISSLICTGLSDEYSIHREQTVFAQWDILKCLFRIFFRCHLRLTMFWFTRGHIIQTDPHSLCLRT